MNRIVERLTRLRGIASTGALATAVTLTAAPAALASTGALTFIGGVDCTNAVFAVGSSGPIQGGITDWTNPPPNCGSNPSYDGAWASGSNTTHTAEVRTWFTENWTNTPTCAIWTYVPAAIGNNSTDPGVTWFIDSLDNLGVHFRAASGSLNEYAHNGWYLLATNVPFYPRGRIEVAMDNTGSSRAAFSIMKFTCSPV